MFSNSGLAPESVMDVLLLPFLATFFGVAARMGAVTYMRTYGRRPNHLWITYLPLAFAILLGISWLYQLYNPDEIARMMYRQTIPKGRVRVAHFIAFLVPLLTTLAIVLYDRRQAPRIRAARR